MANFSVPRTIEWIGGLDGYVQLIDQTLLPAELVMLECRDLDTMWHAIQRLQVRGAPAIGVAAAMGVVLGVRNAAESDRSAFLQAVDKTCDHLATSRPTAVNLFWALERMRRVARTSSAEAVAELKAELLTEAKRIRDEDAAMCRAIGRHGESLIREGAGVLTHCNAGSLATSEYGTATAPMYAAHAMGRSFHVYSGETRPLLQGARLTVWELTHAGIDVTLLCDNMVGALMQTGKVDLVITGADRIAANGDTANKIGTYSMATLAAAHGIPFYVAAPSSTFDLAIADGSKIPIEFRDPSEIRALRSETVAPHDVPCYTPAFDVTPARLIQGIITERGIIQPVRRESIHATLTGTS